MLPVLVVAALCGLPAPDSTKTSASPEVDRLIKRMGDDQWDGRRAAFYDLRDLGDDNKKPDDETAIRRALIQALEVENSHVSNHSDLSGDYTDYYGDLIAAVSSLKDPESADALAGALGSGTMVVRALVELGDASVDPVLKRLSSSESISVSHSCCMVLRLMVRPSNRNPISDPELTDRIKNALARKPCKR